MLLDDYRREAEEFVSALDRDYYLQGSGQKEDLDVEDIYERHAGLFTHEAVEELRAEGRHELALFAAQGLVGRETRTEQAELARLEATLEVEGMPFRQAAVAQANEPDPARRSELEAARLATTARELDPLLVTMLERSHAVAEELGFESLRELVEELGRVDLGRLHQQTEQFLAATDPRDAAPRLEAELGIAWGDARRSDLPAFFRAPSLDDLFPADRLLDAYEETRAALGLSAPGVRLDAVPRPTKSPRAFCAPVHVPDEVYLVIPRLGGREDYEALMHEAGHAEHFAHADRELPFEHRYLGDNSVTEGYAFLLQHLVRDAGWLHARLGVEDAGEVEAHARAERILFLRRYCAKLGYELELHGPAPDLAAMPALYSERLSAASGLPWPEGSWIADVDAFFYAARYLRAWALEELLRTELVRRFGAEWWNEPEAGALLSELWREGQRRDADELLTGLTGAELDFSKLVSA
ncbi:MAG: hypothetical protein H0T15_04220 [Thermoleophilaceae bacterium]|nr:hypothetical protein [Thermoleophilaceae bacterium]